MDPLKNIRSSLISCALIGYTVSASILSAGDAGNPLLQEWDTPCQAPDFSQIKICHYMPALEAGIAQQEAEITAITTNPESPTFENTMLALDTSGALLDRVESVFGNQYGVDSNEAFQQLAREAMPLVTAHTTSIHQNQALFERIKALYETRDSLDLEVDELKYLEDTYRRFVKSGALLDEAEKARVKELQTELSGLTLQFGQNVLNDTNSFEIVVDSLEELDGLPESMKIAASEEAEKRGYAGKYVFFATRSTVEPVTTYANNRKLRERLFTAYIECANRNNAFDNKAIIRQILDLRIELANLLGYPNWTAYALDDCMAENVDQVLDLTMRVWEPAIKAAKRDVAEMQKLIDSEEDPFTLAPWDYRYYAEKIRKQNFDLSEAEIKPYFKLENVRQGVFNLAEKLYGVHITKREDVPVYHEDVDAWEVQDLDGSHVGIFLTDYLVRDTKKAGAWMSAYRSQQFRNGEFVTPIIVNVCNFPRPSADQPTLLSLDEVLTMFHEFGHATHGLFSKCRLNSEAGTSVPRDFVELPSMINENWALEPELLKTYAFHYETGEVIPDELLEKIEQTATFNQGFGTVEYLAAVILDLEYHRLDEPLQGSIADFEHKILTEKYGLIPEIIARYRSTFFQHIFAGGYSSRYYSYLWSEVLDADAYEKFKEDGIFNRATADAFRENVLSKGGSDDPMKLYRQFRGHDPQPEALLKRNGFL
jgi:peptidyl-dipeptidase Dcp